jgi:diguanylate cyclase (GGDEF)-like protein/PAS domain S-box-containing protein
MMIKTKLEDALNDARILAESVIETIDESLLILDEGMHILSANKAFYDVFSVTEKETKGRIIYELGNGQWNIEALREMLETIVPRDGCISDFEVRREFPRIGTRTMSLHATRINQEGGRRKLILLIIKDITASRKIDEHMLYVSFHDTVTSLYNRAYFEEELARQDTERELPLSIIMGDVNNLKRVNDIFGHAQGDKLLQKIAEILKACCRSNDIVSRWGGDEFIVILPHTDREAAEQVVGKVNRKCSEYKDSSMHPSIALGIGTKKHKTESMARIMKEAENEMYADKKRERLRTGSSAETISVR